MFISKAAKMSVFRWTLLVVCGIGIPCKADVGLDLDFSTSAIDTSITIPVGSTLDIAAVEINGVSQPRDRVGIDLYYQLPGDTTASAQLLGIDASFAPVPTLAGTLAGLSASGQSEDLFVPAGFISTGSGLKNGTLPPVSGYLNSIGGVGYTADPTAVNFPNTFPTDVARWRFLFPNVGSVHFELCGILDSNGDPVMPLGSVYHEVDTRTSHPTSCSPVAVVHVVPEPSAWLFLSMLACVLCGRRWWSSRKLASAVR